MKTQPVDEARTPRYRSAAVARMLRMPVATLRVWERRYRLCKPATTPAGHRLYSAVEVRRLALLKQLSDAGHAIGTLAALSPAQLRQVAQTHVSTLAASPTVSPAALPASAPQAVTHTARRFDDATLAAMAGLSSTMVCECPRHVAELLTRLSQFEAYSAECRQRSPADAQLHAYLQQVASTARALFETALERVVVQEGLLLPPAPPPAP